MPRGYLRAALSRVDHPKTGSEGEGRGLSGRAVAHRLRSLAPRSLRPLRSAQGSTLSPLPHVAPVAGLSVPPVRSYPVWSAAVLGPGGPCGRPALRSRYSARRDWQRRLLARRSRPRVLVALVVTVAANTGRRSTDQERAGTTPAQRPSSTTHRADACCAVHVSPAHPRFRLVTDPERAPAPHDNRLRPPPTEVPVEARRHDFLSVPAMVATGIGESEGEFDVHHATCSAPTCRTVSTRRTPSASSSSPGLS